VRIMAENVRVRFIKLNEFAKQPTYANEYAAGADLYAATNEKIEIKPMQTVMVGTGIATEIPNGYVGLVFARSGLASKKGLAPANKVGVIDSDYRGEIKVALHNHSDSVQSIDAGERIAQFVIIPYLHADFELTEELTETQRGAGGFGSTGKL
jgi:dUTP pyrophosphatase